MNSIPLARPLNKRVLVYSHDTFGLGNIRRMLEVARHLVQSSPEVSVLLLTGSPMLHAFRIPPRIDYVKLPCLMRDNAGQYSSRSLPLDLSDVVRLRSNIITSTIVDFAPDLVLVDKRPFGVERELAGALQAFSRARRRPHLVLLLRDILDSADATRRLWQKYGYYEAVATHYDQVLVVGSPEIFDLRLEYAFPPFVASKVRYCGYIAREAGFRSRAQVRAALGVAPSEPLLLVTPGGGEDGYGLVATLFEGLRRTAAHRRPRTHVVCGPEMPQPQRAALRAAAAALPQVSVQDFCDDMMSLIASADVAVTMAGYNTVCELLTCGRRAVVIPRATPGREQLIRAERMASLGLLRMLAPDAASPFALMAEVQHHLDALARAEPLPRLGNMKGLQDVTRSLRGLMGLDRHSGASPFDAPAYESTQPEPAPLASAALASTALGSNPLAPAPVEPALLASAGAAAPSSSWLV